MNIIEKFKEINEYYSPKIIGEVNDVYIKLVVAKGEDIPWHNHQNEDEMFFVVEGNLLMEIEGKPALTLKSGDLYIVKKGVNHRVSAREECKIMLVENKSTKHTGDLKTQITKSVEDQLL